MSHFHFLNPCNTMQTVDLHWTSSKVRVTTHSPRMVNDNDYALSPTPCDFPVHQCNAIVPLHSKSCPMYKNLYMDTLYCTLHRVPWTPYIVHYTVYHGHSCLMHTKSIHSLNVNIHAVILTFITFMSTHQTRMHQHHSDYYLDK